MLVRPQVAHVPQGSTLQAVLSFEGKRRIERQDSSKGEPIGLEANLGLFVFFELFSKRRGSRMGRVTISKRNASHTADTCFVL